MKIVNLLLFLIKERYYEWKKSKRGSVWDI